MAENSTEKIGMFIDAGIHSREWIAPAIALYVIDELVNNPKYFKLLKKIDFYIAPMLNPDGYEYSRIKDRMWRRTRSSGKHSGPCIGVDLNRNFPYHWNESGTSGDFCSEIYSGPTPLSEPEGSKLADFLLKNNSTLSAYLTLHSYGNYILYPWGFQKKAYTDDLKHLESAAKQMAEAIQNAGGPSYSFGTGPDLLYEAAGGSDDFAKSLGIKYAYTMELTSGDLGGFVLPEKHISQCADHVIPGIMKLAEIVSMKLCN